MKKAYDRNGVQLKKGAWANIHRTNEDGTPFDIVLEKIVHISETSVSLTHDYWISDGFPLGTVQCLEIETDKNKIMIAMLEN